MSDDIKTHLETIRDIDSAGYDRGRERAQALEHVAGAVADAMLEGRTAPVYCGVEGFFITEGFDQAVAAQLVVRHATLIEQRAKLADRLEAAGVAYGPEAARILRAMNPAAEPVPKSGLDFRFNGQTFGVDIKSISMPGWTVERTPDGGAKGFFRNVILDEVDSEPFEKPATPTTYEATRAAHAKAKAEKAALDASIRTGLITPGGELHQTMGGDIARRIYDAIAELRSNPDSDAITHTLAVDGCWVDVKVDRVVIDPLPDFDSVYPDNIRAGDIAEYHTGDSVRRWVVLTRGLTVQGTPYVQLQLADDHINATETIELPLPGDPFILRPRS